MDIVSLIEAGGTSAVYLAFAGIVLGGLHGLEPGHSKTMMAAFIIAVRGTVSHAVLLGVSAALSHSVIVWILAALALTYGDALIGEKLEPYVLMASGAIIVIIGMFMVWHLRTQTRPSTHGHTHQHHEHDHKHEEHPGHDDGKTPLDAHALAHAHDIEARFSGGTATTWQTIGFGLTGGLIPCPAAITVLLLCLNIDKVWLGVGMVAAFSAGLAITLVLVGVTAAVGLRYARTHSAWVDRFYHAAPYVSGVLILVIGVYMGWSGWSHLP
ncbi:MAG: nickel/cobalt efflux transporter RcnA [Chromatiales bacterium]|jgi:nickel/cobalt transporter (NicO) family protein|nr:nickel/cobalt efflux transporter RcnA [Chromatiales bacterium]